MDDGLHGGEAPAIACIGGAHLDRKARLAGTVRLGSSNPVTVSGAAGGVARNVAEAVARLGHAVSLFSAVGRDDEGEALLAALAGLGVGVAHVRRAQAPTGSYTAVLDRDGALVLGLADMTIYDALDPAWADATAADLSRHPIWVVDANLPGPTIERLLRHKGRARVFADPVSAAKAKRLLPVLGQLDGVFPDRAEAAALSGLAVETAEQALTAARAIRARGPDTVLVSFGAEGLAVARPGEEAVLPAPPARVVDVTGAGDALIAGYLHGLLTANAGVRYGLAAAGLALACEEAVPPDLTPARLARAAGLAPAAE